jgi:[acyl-carrier-protein] S-malonyltransferase
MSKTVKERVVVICPGRGSYTKESLGYLKPYHPKLDAFIADLDQRRTRVGQPTLSELDNAEAFQPSVHTKGEHASALIYACAAADFSAINQEKFEIVAITGNSMGWYIASALAGALDWGGAFDVINTMGSMMKDKIVGGQIIYPITDENWQRDPARLKLVEEILAEVNSKDGNQAYISIWLGGYVVIGGNASALNLLLKQLPKNENYPFQLINHAAFHTPLLQETSERAFEILPQELFHRPHTPLIDGRGHTWNSYNTDEDRIYDYTLGHQVFCPYDFSTSLTVALKEFAPDRLILLGPGNSLGGAIGQILIANRWLGISSKQEFSERQKQDPFLISMGLPEQKARVS